MIRNVTLTIPAMHCTCDICGYEWVSTAKEPPECCARKNPPCRSREWNGKKHLSHINEVKLPKPRKPGRERSIALLRDGEE